jgi:hypothetical protein
MGWTAWSTPGTALVDGVPLRALAVARDDEPQGGLVRVVLSEDLGMPDVHTDEREIESPEPREVVLPLAAFHADDPFRSGSPPALQRLRAP